MFGLDIWNGKRSQVQSFKNRTGVTFPLLLNAGRIAGTPFNMEDLIVVGHDGIVGLSKSGLRSSISAGSTEAVVENLLRQIPQMPVIAVQQTAVDFGTIDAGQTDQQTITITNTGTAPLEITGIESDVPGLTFEPSMFTLSPDSSAAVMIVFPGSTAGEFSGLINILSNDPNRAMHTLSVSIIIQGHFANPKADFNRDKEVNITDFLLFVNAFGSTDSTYDIDGDGVVGLSDFLLFVDSFGRKVGG